MRHVNFFQRNANLWQSLNVGQIRFQKLQSTCVKACKNGPSKICGRLPLKKVKVRRPYNLKVFKGCLPEILLGPFLNTLTQITVPLKILKPFLKIFVVVILAVAGQYAACFVFTTVSTKKVF